MSRHGHAEIAECLARLAPFLDLSRIAITGGVALQLQLDPPSVVPGGRPSLGAIWT